MNGDTLSLGPAISPFFCQKCGELNDTLADKRDRWGVQLHPLPKECDLWHIVIFRKCIGYIRS
jgi:hypothetical protein